MSLKVITTTRGNVAIQHKNFNFRKNRTLVNGDVSWRCVNRNCTASLKTSNDFKSLRSKSGVHNHEITPSSTTSASSPSATPTPQEPDKNDQHSNKSSSDTPNNTPSLTDLLSPYVTITPAQPKYSCLEKENSYLRQRVAELQYQTDALTDKAIELEKKLMLNKEINHTTSDTPDTQLPTSYSPTSVEDINSEHSIKLEKLAKEIEILKQPCKKCKIYKEESENMIQSIRGLEEEIKTLKQTVTPLHLKPTLPTVSNSLVLPLSNSFEILSTIPHQDNNNNEFSLVTNKRSRKNSNKILAKFSKPSKKFKKQFNNYRTRIPLRNVTVVGDSHCRGLAALMTSRATNYTCITGVCKPGAGLLDIAPTSTPPDDHAYVIFAGTNDVAVGREATIFQNMEKIIEKCAVSSRVLVAPLPFRHDLPSTSSVHKSVALVNNFIGEICHRHEGVEMLDLSELRRRYFTRHGLHLNAAGKKVMADLIIRKLVRASSNPRRRPVDSAMSPLLNLSPPDTITMHHETYLDAVVNGPSSRDLSQPTSPLLTTQTSSRPTANFVNKPVFLGTPLANNSLN